jgi:Thioesterase domain
MVNVESINGAAPAGIPQSTANSEALFAAEIDKARADLGLGPGALPAPKWPANRAAETVFIGGAGDRGAYKQDFVRALTDAGIENVRPSDPPITIGGKSSLGFLVDAAAGVPFLNGDAGPFRIYDPQLAKRSSRPEEPYNLIGYSWGAVLAAQQAVATADKGEKVDNLILIGAPINQSLVDQIASKPNIKNVIYVNLTEHGDAIYPGMTDLEIVWDGLGLAWDMYAHGPGTGHFYYSSDDAEGARRRDDLAAKLKGQGLK